jgi:hypothetical protein
MILPVVLPARYDKPKYVGPSEWPKLVHENHFLELAQIKPEIFLARFNKPKYVYRPKVVHYG